MTIGQRITERRKQKGLSQEALGDIMDVSRQAVSKWESDETVPELEKLIKLSAVFDVSVGWLINGEEEKVVEKEVQVKEGKTAPRWLCIVLSIALLLSIFIGYQSVLNLKSQVTSLNDNLMNISYELSRERANTYQAIQDALNEYTSSILDKSFGFTNFDLKNNTVDVNIKLSPKTYKEGMSVLFVIDNDGEKVEGYGIHQSDHSFTLEKTIKLTNDISVSAQLIYPDSTELIDLGSRKGLYNETFPYYSFTWTLSFSVSSGYLEKVCELMVYNYEQDHDVETTVQSMKCQLFEDDKLLCEYTLIDGLPENWSFIGAKMTPSDNPLDGVLVEENGTIKAYKMYFFQRPDGIKLDQASHEYKEVLTVVDGLDRTKIRENYWDGEQYKD